MSEDRADLSVGDSNSEYLWGDRRQEWVFAASYAVIAVVAAVAIDSWPWKLTLVVGCLAMFAYSVREAEND